MFEHVLKSNSLNLYPISTVSCSLSAFVTHEKSSCLGAGHWGSGAGFENDKYFAEFPNYHSIGMVCQILLKTSKDFPKIHLPHLRKSLTQLTGKGREAGRPIHHLS